MIVYYGLSPFRVFHSWFSLEGFSKTMEDSWENDGVVVANGMVKLKKKLKCIKVNIKV